MVGIKKKSVVVNVADLKTSECRMVSIKKGAKLCIEDTKGKKQWISWTAKKSGEYVVCKELKDKKPVITIYPMDENFTAKIEGTMEIYKDGSISMTEKNKERPLRDFIEDNFEFDKLTCFNCVTSRKRLRITIEEVE